MSSGSVYLSHARYGKQAVRVFRVVKEDKWHTVVEYNVTVLLEGDIDVSYTKADNSVVVATDSMKNITYHLAKTSPHILHPERFALHLGTYMVSKYSHIHKSFVTVEQLRWKRIDVNGQEHSHSFWRDGDEKRFASVEVDATKGKDKIVATVSAGISDLLVLKSTGSAFENFVRDEHTTLAEVNDRIFSTSIDLKYTYAPFSVPTNAVVDSFKLAEDVSSEGTAWDGDAVAAKARTATLEVFAVDESASVQASLHKMAERILSENKHVQTVSYSLPNKHYIPVDMRYAGIDNLTPCVS
ncbi:uricase, partial [Irpex lacteus]